VKQKDKLKNSEMVKGLSLVTQIAFSVFACVSVGVFIGYRLDQWLGTSWLLPVFALLGAGAAFKSLYDLVKKL
jgi:F0F1-type ATP synthase assembly protein I